MAARDVATPNLDRLAARGRDRAAHATVARAAHAAVARLALHRPLSRRARHPRQRRPAARRGRAAAGGDPAAARLQDRRRSSRRSCCRRSPGSSRGFGTYSRRVRHRRRRCAVPQHDPEARRQDTVAEAIAWLREPGTTGASPWVHLYDPHDPYEPPEPYASRYAGPAVRRRGGVVRRARRPLSTALGAAPGAPRRHAPGRHVRPRRGARRTRRERPRLLRLRDDAARAADLARSRHRAGTPHRRRRPAPSTCCRRCSSCWASVDRADAGEWSGRQLAAALARRAAVAGRAAALPSRWRRSCTTGGATCARARRALEVHPGAAPRAVRPPARSRRAANLAASSRRAPARCARGSRRSCAPSRRRNGASAPRFRPTCSRSSARSATSARRRTRRRRDRRRSEGQDSANTRCSTR